jgi:hypothetical protein
LHGDLAVEHRIVSGIFIAAAAIDAELPVRSLPLAQSPWR